MDQQIPTEAFYLNLKIGELIIFLAPTSIFYVWKSRLTYFGTNLLRKSLRYKI